MQPSHLNGLAVSFSNGQFVLNGLILLPLGHIVVTIIIG